MGGAKKKSPAQQEKSQVDDTGKTSGAKKKGKKQEKSEGSKSEISVIINDQQAMKFIKSAKVLTVQELARQTGVKISAANTYLQKLLHSGAVKRIGGFSGHHVYQPVTE